MFRNAFHQPNDGDGKPGNALVWIAGFLASAIVLTLLA